MTDTARVKPAHFAPRPLPRPASRRRRPLLIVAAALGGAAAAAVAVWLLWPRVSLSAGGSAIASVHLRGPGVSLATASADAAGRSIALRTNGSALSPLTPLAPGRTVRITVTTTNPGWIAWLAGPSARAELTVPAPSPRLVTTTEVVTPGHGVQVVFDQPVVEVRWTDGSTGHVVHLGRPETTVALAAPAGGALVRTLEVSGSARTWEAEAAPARLTYFVGSGQMASVSPAPGSTGVAPSDPVTVTLSRPVRSVFGSRLPTVAIDRITAPVAGRWVRDGAYTLEFRPQAGSVWPGQDLTVRLPVALDVVDGRTSRTEAAFSYATAPGSVTRLQELLARLQYLPLDWTSPGPTATTVPDELARATDAPAGTFAWRWQPPARLAALWQPGAYNVMTDAAVKAFEHVSGLDPVGLSNPLLWPYLSSAALADRVDPHGYTWVDVSKTLPEHLTLWRNGVDILTALTNTGIPQAPTADGSFAVYLRYKAQVMHGTNPDGTKYADPVVWVSYFNGSDAVHGFVRASYGFPQSVGCAELPYATAGQVWPHMHIGTIVTVHS
jgi:hypothetical protein